MNSLLALLQEELRQRLPELLALNATLAQAEDAAALARWQQRIEALRGAATVFPRSRLGELLAGLLRSWNPPPAQRDSAAASVSAALQQLAAIAAAPEADAERLLQALGVEPAAPSAAPAAAGASSASPRLQQLFAQEVGDKTASMGRVLLQLESAPDRLELIAPLMRAAHSLKGAARAVQNAAAVQLTHALEDALSAAQRRSRAVDEALVDLALRALDTLRALATRAEPALQAQAAQLAAQLLQRGGSAPAGEAAVPPPPAAGSYLPSEDADPLLRVRASLIGRMISLASSGLVESRRLQGFAERQLRLRRDLLHASRTLDELHRLLGGPGPRTPTGAALAALRGALTGMRGDISVWLDDFGEYRRDATDLTERVYAAAAQTRLRPFADIAGSYPRTVRDLARQLGKRVRLQLSGETLPVDRDVLEQLDAPLNHLLRNAVDHGIEPPARRGELGKPEEGTLRLAASYRTGLLAIELGDDGAGIDEARVRQRIVERGLLDAPAAAALDTAALCDFLFHPGFSTRDEVTEVSGRGVGLDVVQQMLKQLDGSLRISTRPGHGTSFHLLVPISRAVTRSLVVAVGGELYAFPLLRLERIHRAEADQVAERDGIAYLPLDGRNVGLVPLAEQLELGSAPARGGALDCVIVEREGRRVGFIVDRIVGEMDLATRPLDPRLGQVAEVSAVAILPDGEPVVLLDVEDLIRSALERQRRQQGAVLGEAPPSQRARAVLVADDSISVRELVRQLLAAEGYCVEVAVDGMDAWNKLRSEAYDLLITDIDMPRMNGIELTRSLKQDVQWRNLPIVIVSYRDRPEDRAAGLEARADAYLTKGDFEQDRFMQTVHDLIGPARGGA